MKEWWMNLGLREKQLLSIGAMFIILFLLYEIIWSPISTHNETLREEITHDQKLLSWMQEADQRIQATTKLFKKSNTSKQTASILSVIQHEIDASPLKNNLTQMSQAENNAVQLTFQKVNFDALIQWITLVWKTQNMTVKQMTATPNGTLGSVDSTIILIQN